VAKKRQSEPSYELEEEELERLATAIEAADRQIQPFRDKRIQAMREFVGFHYGEGGSEFPTPINLMYFNTQVYTKTLAARTPQALMTTVALPLKSAAVDLEIATNHVLREMDLGDTLNLAVFDALYGIGVIKTGCVTRLRESMRGFSPVSGEPYADVVDLDDFFFDVNAKSWKAITFMGNRYRVPLRDAKENPAFDKKVAKELEACPKRLRQERTGELTAESISRRDMWEVDEFEDHVDLQDVYLPQRGILMTLTCDSKPQVLRSSKFWENPYKILAFTKLPSQIMPLAPAMMWLDLHTLENELMSKASEQALDQKNITLVQQTAVRDGQRVVQSRNGDTIVVDSTQGVTPASFPGADQGTLLMVQQVKMLSNVLFGNPEALAGVGQQAETLGQDQLIAAAANRMIGSMQDTVVTFTEKVIRSIARLILTDPYIKIPLAKSIEGEDIQVPFYYTPDRAKGTILDYSVNIEPYSLQHISPAQRLRMLSELVTGVIFPGQQMLMESGGTFDIQEYLRIYGRYSGLQEVNQLVTFSEVQPNELGMDGGQRQGSAGKAPMPAVTRRENIRRNVPGRGQEDQLNQALMSAVQRGGQRGGFGG
jgi:hypothetical protein